MTEMKNPESKFKKAEFGSENLSTIIFHSRHAWFFPGFSVFVEQSSKSNLLHFLIHDFYM